MSISTIFKNLLGDKTLTKSHLRNLFEMALIDGHFDEREEILLHNMAKKNNISRVQLNKIKKSAEIEFKIPEDERDKFTQFYNLVQMILADDKIQSEEIQLCHLLGEKLGYNKKYIEELTSSIIENIRNDKNIPETMKRVEWMLK